MEEQSCAGFRSRGVLFARVRGAKLSSRRELSRIQRGSVTRYSRRDPSFAARPEVIEKFAARTYVGGANWEIQKLMLVSSEYVELRDS